LDAEKAYRSKLTSEALRDYLHTIVWWHEAESYEDGRLKKNNYLGFDEIDRSVQAQTIIVWLANKLVGPAKKTGKPPTNQNPQSPFFRCPFTDLEGHWLVHQLDRMIGAAGILAAWERLKQRVSDGRVKAPGDYVERNQATTLQAHYTRAKSRLQKHSA
jgi:hypothetical protein